MPSIPEEKDKVKVEYQKAMEKLGLGKMENKASVFLIMRSTGAGKF